MSRPDRAYRRNADERLRDLERQAAAGNHEARVAIVEEWAALGGEPRLKAIIAAALLDPDARLALDLPSFDFAVWGSTLPSSPLRAELDAAWTPLDLAAAKRQGWRFVTQGEKLGELDRDAEGPEARPLEVDGAGLASGDEYDAIKRLGRWAKSRDIADSWVAAKALARLGAHQVWDFQYAVLGGHNPALTELLNERDYTSFDWPDVPDAVAREVEGVIGDVGLLGWTDDQERDRATEYLSDVVERVIWGSRPRVRRNGDEELRELERRLRAGDVDAVAPFLETSVASGTGDRAMSLVRTLHFPDDVVVSAMTGAGQLLEAAGLHNFVHGSGVRRETREALARALVAVRDKAHDEAFLRVVDKDLWHFRHSHADLEFERETVDPVLSSSPTVLMFEAEGFEPGEILLASDAEPLLESAFVDTVLQPDWVRVPGFVGSHPLRLEGRDEASVGYTIYATRDPGRAWALRRHVSFTLPRGARQRRRRALLHVAYWFRPGYTTWVDDVTAVIRRRVASGLSGSDLSRSRSVREAWRRGEREPGR